MKEAILKVSVNSEDIKGHFQEFGLKRAVALLNEINELDPSVLPALIKHRVTCNTKLAEHPTVQVGIKDDEDGVFEVGLLGILNGIFGVKSDDWGYIEAHFDNEQKGIIRFVANMNTRQSHAESLE